MPVNEREIHPFLNAQVVDFNDHRLLDRYCKLVVGTFPIYSITESIPLDPEGLHRKINWPEYARFKLFYGSWGSYFWPLLNASFGGNMPETAEDAVHFLNDNSVLLTDVYTASERVGYSPDDANLRNQELNLSIYNIIDNATNLKVIYFTSTEAKKGFCAILDIPFNNSKESIENIGGVDYNMIMMLSPGGNPRRAPDFFNTFPLNEEEAYARDLGTGYAIAYRKRYYQHYLTLPCH